MVLTFAEYIFRNMVTGITVGFRHPNKRSLVFNVYSVLSRDCLFHTVIIPYNTSNLLHDNIFSLFHCRLLPAAEPRGFRRLEKSFTMKYLPFPFTKRFLASASLWGRERRWASSEVKTAGWESFSKPIPFFRSFSRISSSISFSFHHSIRRREKGTYSSHFTPLNPYS